MASGGVQVSYPEPLEDRKLFVGGLGWDTTEKQLSEYFGKFGEVESINVKTNPNTGRSRGFAFIVFANTDCIDQILNGSDHIINGRKVDAKKAITRSGKIFVGGLTQEISEEDIRNFFSQYGKVIDVEIPFDKQRSQRRGFGFITIEQEHVVNELLKNPQQVISGVAVDLRKATPKTDSTVRGGGGGGGMRGGRGGGFGRSRGSGYGGYGNYGSYGSQSYSGYGGGYGGYSDSSYSGYGGYGGSSYGGGYDYSNGYGDQSSYDGQRRQPQSRHQPY